MTEQDIKEILAELNRWESGELGSKLTWHRISDFSGYTRKALYSKPEIRSAFEIAKKALSKSGKTRIARERGHIGYLEKKLKAVERELAMYKKREKGWLIKWQRVAYHIMEKGIVGIQYYDQPIPENASLPDQKTTNNVIEFINKPLPPKNAEK